MIYYSSTRNLKKPVESKDEGVKYPCVNCEYAATSTWNLKKHVESKDEGVKYFCVNC